MITSPNQDIAVSSQLLVAAPMIPAKMPSQLDNEMVQEVFDFQVINKMQYSLWLCCGE